MTLDLFHWQSVVGAVTSGSPATGSDKRRLTIDERWAAFNAVHPQLYRECRRLALEAVRRGRKRFGIAAVFEVARWNLALPDDEDGFKANNDFRAVVSRLLMEHEPELADVFEIRTRRTE